MSSSIYNDSVSRQNYSPLQQNRASNLDQQITTQMLTLLTKVPDEEHSTQLNNPTYVRITVNGEYAYAKIVQLEKLLNITKEVILRNPGKIGLTIELVLKLAKQKLPQPASQNSTHGVREIEVSRDISLNLFRKVVSFKDSNKVRAYLNKNPNAQATAIRTILAVGQELAAHKGEVIHKEKVISLEDQKDKSNKAESGYETLTSGFTISAEGDVYIHEEGEKFVNTGQFKTMQPASKLGSDERFLLMSGEGEKGQKIQAEAEKLEAYRGLQNVLQPALMTYKFEGHDRKKVVMIQKRYDGDAAKVFKERQNDIRGIISVLRDAANGLASMHSKGIFHFDVKPDNILVNGKVGIMGDLGEARTKKEYLRDKETNSIKRVANYTAPEESSSEPAKDPSKFDSFSLGVTIFAMVTRQETPKMTLRDKNMYVTPVKIPFGISEDGCKENEIVSGEELMKKEMEDQIALLDLKIAIVQDNEVEPKERENKVKELEMRKQALDIVRPLLLSDPDKRISCEDARNKLNKLLENFDDFPVSKIPDPNPDNF